MPHLSTPENPYPLEPLLGADMEGEPYFFKAKKVAPQSPAAPQGSPYAGFQAPGQALHHHLHQASQEVPSYAGHYTASHFPAQAPSFYGSLSTAPHLPAQQQQQHLLAPAPPLAPSPAAPVSTHPTLSADTMLVYNYMGCPRTRELHTFPIQRQWLISPDYTQSDPLHSSHKSHRLAGKAQLVGKVAITKCIRCMEGRGVFPECVVIPVLRPKGKSYLGNACTNCFYTGHIERCSFAGKKGEDGDDQDGVLRRWGGYCGDGNLKEEKSRGRLSC